MTALIVGFLILVAIATLALMLLLQSVMNYFIMAYVSGAPIGLGYLIGLRLRGMNPEIIILSRIRLQKAGLSVPAPEIEAHQEAGGDVARVVGAIVDARAAGIDVTWDEVCALDLEGRDVLSELGLPPSDEHADSCSASQQTAV